MSVVENIVGAVVIVAVLLIMGLLMTTNLMSRLNPLMGPSVRNYEYDLYNSNWHAVINAIEPETGESIHSLVAASLIQFSPDINFEGTVVNVPDKLEEILDIVYGSNNYYFEVYPQIGSVYFSFILDGSGSFADERVMVKDALKKINEDVLAEQTDIDFDLKFLIIILGSDPSAGAIFSNAPGSDLEGIDITTFTIQKPDLVATNFPHYEIEDFGNSGENEKYLYQSDWVTGIQFAFNEYQQRVDNRGFFDLHFIFPLSDEPASSAFPTKCFSRSGRDFLFCTLCDQEATDECNTRGDDHVNLILSNGEIINSGTQIWPLSAVECNYQTIYTADSQWNSFDEGRYPYGGGKKPSETPGVDYWCQFDGCGGCSLDADDNICFHPECQQKTLDQMGALATATGGEIIDVTEAQDLLGQRIGEITNNVINNAEIILGNPLLKLEERNKYAFNKTLHLRAGKTTDIILYVRQ